MRIKLYNVTSSGARLPVEVEVSRVSPNVVLAHQIKDKSQRNKWCTNGKPCAKFKQRPCCPPQAKMFSEYKEREYVYLIMVKMDLEDYYVTYPNVRSSKSWAYFGMDGTHKMTRRILNDIVRTLAQEVNGQGFRVGGCLGCQFPKTGKCNYFMPPLEGTGVNVVSLTKEVFGHEITWAKPKNPMKTMTAVGAIYTNAQIPQKRFKEVIIDVCK